MMGAEVIMLDKLLNVADGMNENQNTKNFRSPFQNKANNFVDKVAQDCAGQCFGYHFSTSYLLQSALGSKTLSARILDSDLVNAHI